MPTRQDTVMGEQHPPLISMEEQSALQRMIETYAGLDLDSAKSSNAHLSHLALQTAHNLRFQHGWSDVRVHYTPPGGRTFRSGLPRPMLSGLPPQRLYVHPDEQMELLQKQKDEGKKGMPALEREREWVLPSHLREPWSLRRFAEVFDAISVIPPSSSAVLVGDGSEVVFDESRQNGGAQSIDIDGLLQQRDKEALSRDKRGLTNGTSNGVDEVLITSENERFNPWRTSQPKRVLLATVDDDSTIVYYIVHDGLAKPRQN